jgi:hypothetical protein
VGGVNLGEEESSVTALTIYGVTTAVVRYEADRSHSEGHTARVLRWARTFNSLPGVIGGLFGSEGPARPEVRLSQCKKSPAEARLEVRYAKAGRVCPAKPYFETNSHASSSR